MDDIREIEFFLNRMKESAKAGLPIYPKMVYANLIRLGRRVVNHSRIENNFPDWINTFKNVDNINVFVSSNWRYFCQFTNDDYNAITPYNLIKMYIPVDDAHINEAAKRIFSYMARNNMVHHSKIGSEVRFDDIVIRIDSEENAKLIEKFVMNDPYIKEGLMKPNPFAFNNGYISYAWDGELSFNTVVASYISNYINELKDNNKLDSVSYKGFVSHVGKIYQAVFKEHKYQNEYINKMGVEEEYQLDNYQKVTELLLQSMMPDKKEKNFYNVYNNIVFGNNKKEDWNRIYALLVEKYGYEETNLRIFDFLEKEDYRIFTRENNIRSYLINNNINKDMIRQLYLTSTKEKRQILADASRDTYEKYGYIQIFGALEKAASGKYKNFTNDFGGRDKMEKYIMPQETHGLIVGYYLEKGYNIKDIPKDKDELHSQYIALLEEKENSKKR